MGHQPKSRPWEKLNPEERIAWDKEWTEYHEKKALLTLESIYRDYGLPMDLAGFTRNMNPRLSLKGLPYRKFVDDLIDSGKVIVLTSLTGRMFLLSRKDHDALDQDAKRILMRRLMENEMPRSRYSHKYKIRHQGTMMAELERKAEEHFANEENPNSVVGLPKIGPKSIRDI